MSREEEVSINPCSREAVPGLVDVGPTVSGTVRSIIILEIHVFIAVVNHLQCFHISCGKFSDILQNKKQDDNFLGSFCSAGNRKMNWL